MSDELPIELDTTRRADTALRDVIPMLRTRTGHDFAQYKRATVLRRIERRLQVSQLRDLPNYRNFLRDHSAETCPLLEDMLISVTNFFRDREAFEALERIAIPTIFDGKSTGEEVRVWVAGCASGEEAYSIAILLPSMRSDRARQEQCAACLRLGHRRRRHCARPSRPVPRIDRSPTSAPRGSRNSSCARAAAIACPAGCATQCCSRTMI